MSASSTAAPLPPVSYGPVALVGAGPGDPELLTVKASRRLEAADVVLHDKLVSEEILGLVPPKAKLINVGKRCGDPKDRGLQQDEIHELMLSHSRQGQRVVRLKCGDPFIFGRGAEELEFLARHGVVAEVVPGITSALGASSSSQIPLTHRDYGVTQVRFVVGQSKKYDLPDLNWDELARDATSETVVMYMALKKLDRICARLIEHGTPADTPMALVESATNSDERMLVGTVGTLPRLATSNGAGEIGPVIFFLGPTAAFPANLETLAGAGKCTDKEPLLEGERAWKRPRTVAMVAPSDC